MKIIKILPLILILLLGSGCVIPFAIPVPADHDDEIDKVLGQLTVGFPTKEEVISILGEPYDDTADHFWYKKKEYRGGAYAGAILRICGIEAT